MMIYSLSCKQKTKQLNIIKMGIIDNDDCTINSKGCECNELISNVIDWANDKGLIKGENSDKQLMKIVEEVGELAGAVIKKNRKDEIDAVGDVMVTLIIFAEIRGYDVMSALQYAYNQIKDRTGKMVDGSFIKDN